MQIETELNALMQTAVDFSQCHVPLLRNNIP